jgi:hypothetical protein
MDGPLLVCMPASLRVVQVRKKKLPSILDDKKYKLIKYFLMLLPVTRKIIQKYVIIFQTIQFTLVIKLFICRQMN